MTWPAPARELDEAERIRDREHGAALAREWVERHRPGLSVRSTTTHSLLYRGPAEMTARVTAELGAPGHPDHSVESTTLLVRVRGGATSIAPFPSDPDLPTLATMLDPRHALHVLMRDAPELSMQLSRRPGLRCDAAVVHHPRTGACVVRYDISGSEGVLRRVYAKVYSSATQARSSAAAHGAVGGRMLRGAPTVRLPRLLGLDLDTRTVFIESLGPSDPPRTGVTPQEAARVLRTVHETPAPPGLPEMGLQDEVGRVRTELAVVRTRWPELADEVEVHVDAVAESLQQGTAATSVLSHGDFTPAQLLRVTPDVIGLIDLDTLTRAEPAVDLGRFLAYSTLRQARFESPGRPVGGRASDAVCALRHEVLCAYGPLRGDGDLARVHAQERVQLALIALRATRRFKEERARLALALLDHASSRRPT